MKAVVARESDTGVGDTDARDVASWGDRGYSTE